MGAQRLRPLAPLRRRWGPSFLLPALLIAALALRLYGIDWDQGHGFHPDERSFYLRADDMFRVLTEAPGHETWLAQWPEMRVGLPDVETALSAERSPLNPHWFPLGSALIYALVLIRSVAEPFTDWGVMDLRFAGRTLAALADTASVALMFAIGRRMYGVWTGLLAAALTTFAVIPHPARPLLPAGAIHRAHVVGGVVGHAPVRGHGSDTRRRPAGRPGGFGHGPQGVGGAHPGSAGAGVPLGLERSLRRPGGPT